MAYFWHVAVNCYFLPLRLILLCSGFWHGWATHKKFDVLFHYGDEGKSLSYKVYGYKNEPKPRLPGKQKRYSTLSGYDWWDEAIFPFRRERTIGTLKFLSSNFWAQLWLMPFRFLWAWRISLFKASASSSFFPHSFHQRSSWLTKPPLGWMWGVGHRIFLWCCIEPWKVFSKSVGCKISDESMQYNNAEMWWGRLWKRGNFPLQMNWLLIWNRKPFVCDFLISTSHQYSGGIMCLGSFRLESGEIKVLPLLFRLIRGIDWIAIKPFLKAAHNID